MHGKNTRLATKTTPQQTSMSPQMATAEKKKLKAKNLEVEARMTLTDQDCLNDKEPLSHLSFPDTLALILTKHSATTPPELMRALKSLEVLMREVNGQPTVPTLADITLQLGVQLEQTVQSEMNKISTAIISTIAEQCKSISSPDTLVDTVSTLKKIASDMSNSIKEATTATTQITDTAHSYKEALLNTAAQAAQRPPPPPSGNRHIVPPTNLGQPLLGIDKKARQILLDNEKGEDNCKNIHEIKEKATEALLGMVPMPPEGTEIQEVIKLRNGSVVLQFATKEAADWIRIPANEVAFTRRYDPEAFIRDRVHPIMVPRIPITFDPNNPKHLREIEEVNRMPSKTIKKARWIKPIYRRAPEQSCAHAIFTISSAAAANRLLKDGIYIFSTRTFPKKLKYEPKQCMKCRKWGHFAANCHALTDTCGSCGDQHMTKDCKTNNKRYCVSCRSDSHASWDRNCPQFLRKCDEYSGFHPENNLLYFLTEEEWTLTIHPERLPIEDKFPNHFTVGSLPQPNHTQRQLPSRPIEKKSKRPGNASNDAGQAVLTSFFDKMPNTQPTAGDNPPARIDNDDNEYDVQFEGKTSNLPENYISQHNA